MRPFRFAIATLPVLAASLVLHVAPVRAADDKSLDALAGPASSRFT